MPPKKKAKGGGGGKKKKGSKSKGELNDEDKLKIKTRQVDILRDHLALRNDFSRQAKAAYEEIRQQLDETNQHVEEIESVHKSSHAYLTHQYKSMQNEMGLRMHQVETELNATKRQLELTEQQLHNEIREKKRIVEEKDEIISDLEQKVHNIQITYDSVIQLTLDKLSEQLDARKREWENSSTKLQIKNKNLLAELGLLIHDI